MKKYIAGLITGLLISLSLTTFAAVKLDAVPSPFPILVNGIQAQIEAYSIKGSTFIKLADLKSVGVDAKYNSDKKQIEIATTVETESDEPSTVTEPAITTGPAIENELPDYTVPEISNTYNPNNTTILREGDDYSLITYKDRKAITYKNNTYISLSGLNMTKKLGKNNAIKVYKNDELIFETINADYKNYVVYSGSIYINVALVSNYLE